MKIFLLAIALFPSCNDKKSEQEPPVIVENLLTPKRNNGVVIVLDESGEVTVEPVRIER